MSELDQEALEGVRAWAQKRLDAHERRLRMAPLYDAMSQSTKTMITSSVPDLMAGPTAAVRRSILVMEKSQDEWPEKVRQEEARQEREMARVRRRTDALRRWLESLS